MADTSVSTRSLSQVPFVFIPYIKRGFFIFQLRHTNAEMKQFFPDSELFLSGTLKPKDRWNSGFTAVPYILHMLRQEHQTIRRVTKALIQRNCSKTPPLQLQYTVIYMITDIGATDQKMTMNGIFLTEFPWKQPDDAWKHKQHPICLLLLPSSWHKVKHPSVTLHNKTC